MIASQENMQSLGLVQKLSLEHFCLLIKLGISVEKTKMTIMKFHIWSKLTSRYQVHLSSSTEDLFVLRCSAYWNHWTQPKTTDSYSQKKRKTTQTSLFSSLSFEVWELIWTKLNNSDLTGNVLQSEVPASFKPWKLSLYMSLLHQQFCFFSWDA